MAEVARETLSGGRDGLADVAKLTSALPPLENQPNSMFFMLIRDRGGTPPPPLQRPPTLHNLG